MPISRRHVGRSVTRDPSIAISPASGARNPATKLSSVVFPQPDGPSSVNSSPRRTCSETSCSAPTSPNRLLMPSSPTAAAASDPIGSTGLFNVEHLSEAEEKGRDGEQRGGRDNVNHRDRKHRRVCVFAHIVVHRDRESLSTLRGDKQRRGEFVERKNGGEQPAAHQTGQQQRQRDGREHARGSRAETGGGKLEAPVEVA